ncbi:MAG: hypothetical protein QME74_06545 [Candidatus Edwardsbacteria bacterium]|nr:hypothetical protein [Candidatus Edwardsbacteria bacterium]
MSRTLWLTLAGCLLIVLARPSPGTAQTVASAQATPIQGRAWINGQEVVGEPWFEMRNDALYYHGRYWYYGKPEEPETTAVVEPAVMKEFQILETAAQSAAGATHRDEWIDRYTSTLNQFLGRGVVSYDLGSSRITICFEGVDVPFGKSIPAVFPITVFTPPTQEKIAAQLAQQAERFHERYRHGVWFFWGEQYTLTVEPRWQEKTLHVLSQIENLAGQSLAKADLESAVLAINRNSTAFQNRLCALDFARVLARKED